MGHTGIVLAHEITEACVSKGDNNAEHPVAKMLENVEGVNMEKT